MQIRSTGPPAYTITLEPLQRAIDEELKSTLVFLREKITEHDGDFGVTITFPGTPRVDIRSTCTTEEEWELWLRGFESAWALVAAAWPARTGS